MNRSRIQLAPLKVNGRQLLLVDNSELQLEIAALSNELAQTASELDEAEVAIASLSNDFEVDQERQDDERAALSNDFFADQARQDSNIDVLSSNVESLSNELALLQAQESLDIGTLSNQVEENRQAIEAIDVSAYIPQSEKADFEVTILRTEELTAVGLNPDIEVAASLVPPEQTIFGAIHDLGSETNVWRTVYASNVVIAEPDGLSIGGFAFSEYLDAAIDAVPHPTTVTLERIDELNFTQGITVNGDLLPDGSPNNLRVGAPTLEWNEGHFLNIYADNLFSTDGGSTRRVLLEGDTLDVSWADITGNQAVVNISGFTNDAGYITNANIPSATSDLTNDSGFITISSVPTAVSQLTNDAGYITNANIPSATSDLTNDSGFITISSVPTAVSQLTNDAGYITNANIPSATSDLTNDSGFITISSVPTAVSQLTNDAGYITNANIPTATSDLTNDSGFITISSVPTAVSQLTNDAGYITNANIPSATSDLTNDSGFITISSVPTAVSQLTNDAGYITNANIPSATSDLTNDSGFITISSVPTAVSQLTNDAGYITSAPAADWNTLLNRPVWTDRFDYLDQVNFTYYVGTPPPTNFDITALDSITPTSNVTYNLGQDGKRWLFVYADTGRFSTGVQVGTSTNFGQLSYDVSACNLAVSRPLLMSRDPVLPLEAATRQYVDGLVTAPTWSSITGKPEWATSAFNNNLTGGGSLSMATGINMNMNVLGNLASPTADNQCATKIYVDTAISGVDWTTLPSKPAWTTLIDYATVAGSAGDDVLVAESLCPSLDSAFNLGQSSLRWFNVFADQVTTFGVSSTTVTASTLVDVSTGEMRAGDADVSGDCAAGAFVFRNPLNPTVPFGVLQYDAGESAIQTSIPIVPAGNNSLSVGTASTRFSEAHIRDMYNRHAYVEQVRFGTVTGLNNANLRYNAAENAIQSNRSIIPNSTVNGKSIGRSARPWGRGYINQLFYEQLTIVSDSNLKYDIEPYNGDALSGIKELQLNTYKYIDDTDSNMQLGLIAQEVLEVPGADMMVTVDDETGYLGINHTVGIALVVRCVQQLAETVDDIKLTLEHMDYRLSNLEV